ncbi:hypothetical protein H2203_006818 [Taxawa tesnikishii (nom. ined.)]|nr:hypothetical protein H2203_006818 [Dothideales sp. JES 119]
MGKVFAKDGTISPEIKSKAGGFNEDVVDFLKPSTEKYSGAGTRQFPAPKIDVAIAQRWPDAADVRRAADGGNILPVGARANGRPKLKKNLTVGFAKAPPEIIGEGGDEAETPSIEVSRARAKMSRSQSDRRPDAVFQALVAQATQEAQAQRGPAPPPPVPEHDFRPRPLQRAQTSHGESSPHFNSKPIQQPLRPLHELLRDQPPEPPEPRPGLLKRAPTGFSSDDSLSVDDDQSPPPMPRSPFRYPSLQSGKGPIGPRSPSSLSGESPMIDNPELRDDLGPSPTKSSSLAARAKHQLRVEEGAAFRRASQNLTGRTDDVPRPSSSSSTTDPASPPMSHRSPQTSPPQSPPHPTHSTHSRLGHYENTSFERMPSERPSLDRPSLDRPSSSRSVQHHPYAPSGHVQDPRFMSTQSTGLRERSRSPLHQEYRQPMATMDRLAMPIDDRRPSSASSHSSQPPFSPQMPSPMFGSPRSPYMSHNLHPTNSGNQPPPSPRSFTRPMPSPNMRGPSPNYFPPQRASPQHTSPATITHLQTESSRPPSSGSQGLATPMTPADEFHAAGLAALDDFGARVAHMKGVFRLTAEREQNMGHVSLEQWLQACLWWFFKGRAGLEGATKQRPRSSDGQPRELLTQAHVDLAKAWWITTDVLDNAHSSPTPGEGHDSGSLATRRSILFVRTSALSPCQ